MKFAQRFGLVLSLCLAVFAPMANGSGAPKANIAVTATPTTASVVNGGSVTFSLSVTTSNVSGNVTMSASGVPLLANVVFSPASFNASSTSTRTVTATLNTNALSLYGNYTIVFQASGGGVSATASAALTICTFKVTASPSTVKIGVGSTASFTVGIARCSGFTSGAALTVSGLPVGATASFSPNPVTGTGTTSNLTISTSAVLTPSGNFTLTIGGIGAVSTTVVLSIDQATGGGKSPFTITGNLSGLLAPGVTGALDLTLTNPNNQDLNVNSLTVALSATNKASCATTNYDVVQFSGSYASVVVPHNASRSLSGLGIASSQWPKVTMKDLPVNQDACKGATITLTYTGTGSGN